jgi:hypothetical protein
MFTDMFIIATTHIPTSTTELTVVTNFQCGPIGIAMKAHARLL